MFAIRRDLKKGPTYGHWQISECKTRSKLGKAIEYIDGTKYSLLLDECYLHNSVATAKRVHEGAYRERCGWIVCKSYKIVPNEENLSHVQACCPEVSYNPKKSPHYLCDGVNVDKTEHELIQTVNYQLYVCD